MSLKISKDKFFYDNFLKNPNKNLSRIKSLLSKLGNPESTLSNIIHIAGTNGKGSTLAFLKSCLIENNYSEVIHRHLQNNYFRLGMILKKQVSSLFHLFRQYE